MMRMKILLGVDAELSPATQRALITAGELCAQASSPCSLLLTTVIPVTQAATAHPGIYMGQLLPSIVPSWQRGQAEETLHKARLLLQQHGFSLDCVEDVICVGITAEEIVKVAREQQATMIVLGNRGENWRQKLRRFFIGSISRRVLHLAPCPVLLVVPSPASVHNEDPVAWYERAITLYLNEHNGSLSVFTPSEVARRFAPPGKTVGDAETKAATQALERLAHSGTLCRHQLANEIRYVND